MLGDRGARRLARWRRRIRGRASRRRHAPRTVARERRGAVEGRGVSMATKIGFMPSAPRHRSASAAGGERRARLRSSASMPAIERPDPRAQDQPGRQPAEQEDDQEQERQLDVGLNVAPQVERDVGPVAPGEQRDDHRDQDPEHGLQEIAWSGRLGEPRVQGQQAGSSRSRVRFVASALNRPLRRPAAARHSWLRVGRDEVLQTAQKIGLGAFVLLMGASLLAMRPHAASNDQRRKPTAAHLKLASLSTDIAPATSITACSTRACSN